MESDERFERIERTMEFLANSHANFDAWQASMSANQVDFKENQTRFEENQLRSEERQRHFEENQLHFEENQLHFEENQLRFDARMDRISVDLDTLVRVQQGQQELLETVFAAQRRTEEKFQELAESGRNTNSRLDALIHVVDGLIPKRPPQ